MREDLNLDTINEYLSQQSHVNVGPFISIEKMTGGRSNPNYLLSTDQIKYVLRRQPFGQLLRTAHNLQRETQVISALKETKITVPEIIHLCSDKSIIGVDFYIMEYVEGDISNLFNLPTLNNKERKETYLNMVDLLAELHNLDYKKVGLKDFGRSGDYYERQYSRWNKSFELSLPNGITEFKMLSEWLKNHLPKGGKTCLIHGDFRLDNIIFKNDSRKIAALVDWELSTLGDPLSDLGYFLGVLNTPSDFVFPGFMDVDRTLIGIPSEEEMIERYCKLTNRNKIVNWAFYKAFGFFRLSAICAGIQARVMQGNAVDDTSKLFGSLTGKIAEIGLKQIG